MSRTFQSLAIIPLLLALRACVRHPNGALVPVALSAPHSDKKASASDRQLEPPGPRLPRWILFLLLPFATK
jgi:hypothetical protein